MSKTNWLPTRSSIFHCIGELQFGGATTMLKPSRASVEALVRKVPRGKVVTILHLRDVLANRHRAEVTCPFLTRRALLAIAEEKKPAAPLWRVVMGKGEMIGGYPGVR